MKHKHNNNGIGSPKRLRKLAVDALRSYRKNKFSFYAGMKYGQYIAYKDAADRVDWAIRMGLYEGME